MKSTHDAVLILHDIRSAQNVGSLFRSADAAGIPKIYLSSITPAPLDRFGRYRGDIAKTALGAERTIEWSMYEGITALIGQLREQGYQIIAIEQSPMAVDYKSVELRPKTAFVLGNEVDGISNDVLQQVDIVAEIPMRGSKESLNVSVAGGIALFRILNI